MAPEQIKGGDDRRPHRSLRVRRDAVRAADRHEAVPRRRSDRGRAQAPARSRRRRSRTSRRASRSASSRTSSRARSRSSRSDRFASAAEMARGDRAGTSKAREHGGPDGARGRRRRVAVADVDPAAPILDPSSARVATASGWNVPDGSAPMQSTVGARADARLEAVPMPDLGPVSAPRRREHAMANPGSIPSMSGADRSALDAVPHIADIPPTRRRTVPPTRIDPDVPSTRMLPLRGLPFTRNQLLLGGGVLVLLIIIIAAATSGSGASAKPVAVAAGSAMPHPDAASTDPVAPALARASDLYRERRSRAGARRRHEGAARRIPTARSSRISGARSTSRSCGGPTASRLPRCDSPRSRLPHRSRAHRRS